jgi:hypothetical protein
MYFKAEVVVVVGRKAIKDYLTLTSYPQPRPLKNEGFAHDLRAPPKSEDSNRPTAQVRTAQFACDSYFAVCSY